jgi:serine/threonine protein kinase
MEQIAEAIMYFQKYGIIHRDLKSKNILIDEDEFSFSRSNKIKQVKKEEKKIEDIVQNLTDRT